MSAAGRWEPESLRPALADVAQRFAWPLAPDALTPVATWDSRTARLSRWQGPHGEPDLVVKQSAEATPRPRQHHERLAWLSEAAARASGEWACPSPWGWTADPPLLCLGFAPGRPLSDAVAQHHPAIDRTTALRAAGALLGTFHVGWAETGPSEPAREAADALLTQAGIRPRRYANQPAPMRAERYTDFRPSNLLADDASRVWVIDPPWARGMDLVHLDLALFLSDLDAGLQRAPGARRARRRLRAAFLEGYLANGPVPAWTRLDGALLAAAEAKAHLTRAHSLRRKRRTREAVPRAGLALAARGRVTLRRDRRGGPR